MSSSDLTNSLGQLLHRAARLVDGRARSSGAGGLRSSQAALLSHLDRDGTRLSVLGERMGVSKQAVGELVEGLQALGLVKRADDPDDKRARLVCLTRHGRKALEGGRSVLGALDAEWTARLGERRVHGMKRDLLAIIELLEEPAPPAETRRRR